MILGKWFRSLAACAAVGVYGLAAQAATNIAYWDFNTLNIPTRGTPAALGLTSIAPTTGTGTLSLANFNGTLEDFTGTSINSIPVNTPGGVSLSLEPGTGLAGNGGYLEFQFSMTGRTNFGVSFATQGTASGFNNNQWSYSTDGTNFSPLGSAIVPATAYSLNGPLVTSALDNAATGYLRYTVNGGTNATGNNRLDNVQLLYDAAPPSPPNPVTYPQGGDIVFGLNNSNASTTVEFVRGAAGASAGVRYPSPYQTQNFLQYVKFDNLNNVRHNANGNLIAVNFSVGGGVNSGAIYSLATQGSIPAPAPQLIGNTCSTCSAALGNAPIGHNGSLTVSNLSGHSIAPDNSKIAVVGEDPGTVIVFDYTPGNAMGTGAELKNGRQTSADPSTRILVNGSSQGTAWKDNNTVLAFSSIGDLLEVDATTMATVGGAPVKTVTTPFIGSNVTSLAYNPDVSPYVYALYSGFSSTATPTSQTKLWVFDPANNYNVVSPGGLTGVDLSLSSQTGREMALDKAGNLFISAFDSTITFIPAANAQNPGTITPNSSVFYYQSTAAATSFVGMDIGFAASLTGDYNLDGKVDAADYVVWRETNINGAQGYTDWKANFGAGTSGSGTSVGGVTAVPEPASLMLVVLGVVGLWQARRRG